MSNTHYGRAWEAFLREWMPNDLGYTLDRAQKAFGAGYAAGVAYKPTKPQCGHTFRCRLHKDAPSDECCECGATLNR